MKKIKNSEIASYIFNKMHNEGYDVSYSEILEMVDGSIEWDDDFDKDEYGEIVNEMSEEEILDLKQKMLNGAEEYFDEIKELEE